MEVSESESAPSFESPPSGYGHAVVTSDLGSPAPGAAGVVVAARCGKDGR